MKLYDSVELLDFQREYFNSKKSYIDTVTVQYNGWDEKFIIRGVHKNDNDITINVTYLSNNRETTVVTGSLKDIVDFYKQVAKRAYEDSDNEIEAALVGFYIYKLPKSLKTMKVNKEAEDIWRRIVKR